MLQTGVLPRNPRGVAPSDCGPLSLTAQHHQGVVQLIQDLHQIRGAINSLRLLHQLLRLGSQSPYGTHYDPNDLLSSLVGPDLDITQRGEHHLQDLVAEALDCCPGQFLVQQSRNSLCWVLKLRYEGGQPHSGQMPDLLDRCLAIRALLLYFGLPAPNSAAQCCA